MKRMIYFRSLLKPFVIHSFKELFCQTVNSSSVFNFFFFFPVGKDSAP